MPPYARYLNGSSDYLTRSDLCGISAYPFTVAGWMRPKTGITGDIVIWSQSDTAVTHTQHNSIVLTVSTARIAVVSRDGATVPNASPTNTCTLDRWNHFCCSYDTSSRICTLNGGTPAEVVTTLAFQGSLDNTVFGARVALTTYRYFLGDMGECAIWSVVLTQQEKSALAKGANPLLIRPSAIVGYWPCGIGSPEPSRHKNNYSLSLAGSPTVSLSGPPVESYVRRFWNTGVI